MEQDIIALQELVAHQNQQILDLSEELHAQQGEISALHKNLSILASKLGDTTDSGFRAPSEETPPPHY